MYLLLSPSSSYLLRGVETTPSIHLVLTAFLYPLFLSAFPTHHSLCIVSVFRPRAVEGGRPPPVRGKGKAGQRALLFLAGRPSPEIFRARGDLPRPPLSLA